MKSGLHNLDTKWTCDMSYSVQLEAEYFGTCILFSEQRWLSVVSQLGDLWQTVLFMEATE